MNNPFTEQVGLLVALLPRVAQQACFALKGGTAINLFYRKPIINATDMEEALSITTPTANALIKALVELGILVEITGQQRWRSYAFERYLRLFIS